MCCCYKCELYVDRVVKIKVFMLYCCIGVDVIVGFFGEMEEDFLEIYCFLNEFDVFYLYVFIYSEWLKIFVYECIDYVDMEECCCCNKMFIILSEKKCCYFYE